MSCTCICISPALAPACLLRRGGNLLSLQEPYDVEIVPADRRRLRLIRSCDRVFMLNLSSGHTGLCRELRLTERPQSRAVCQARRDPHVSGKVHSHGLFVPCSRCHGRAIGSRLFHARPPTATKPSIRCSPPSPTMSSPPPSSAPTRSRQRNRQH